MAGGSCLEDCAAESEGDSVRSSFLARRAFAASPDGFTIRLSTAPEPPRQRLEIDRYLFPCSLLKDRFRFQVDHPASPEDQIQAGAVGSGCDWCPFFDPRDYRRIGTRVASKAVFA